MSLKVVLFVILTGLLVAVVWPENGPAAARSSIQTLTWQGADFQQGEGQNTAVTANGLTLMDTAVTATYLSPIIETPGPFNALVPEWLAEIPEGSSLEIHLRTSKQGATWSDWYDVHAHEDWNETADEWLRGDMIAVPAADKTHQFIQFQVSFGRYAHTQSPLLRQIKVVLIDTSDGPTTAELIAHQQTLDQENPAKASTPVGFENPAKASTPVGFASTPADFPRPFVISRAAWCSQPECWYSDGLEYAPATHLIVHHTATSSGGDTAALVRAIWEYHTFEMEWGDIGYNYLIDLNGIIFEGHLNENYEQLDVVGVHSGAANTGSMAASLIGDFRSPDEGSNNVPPPAMLNALADLFAWKADQRNINPYDANRMVNVSWGLPHITSHRDVYGGAGTLCPGGNLHLYLPWLRDAVATRIGFVSPYLYVDELSSSFSRSTAVWNEGPLGCGNNNHSFYAWSTTDPGQAVNWGRWALDVPWDGRYRLEIYAPYCSTGAPETTGAQYSINHAHGNSTVTINQDANVGLWMTLGEFDLSTNSDDHLFLTNLTATDNGRGVWFDGVRLLYVGEPDTIAPVSAVTAVYQIPNRPGYTLHWSGTDDRSGISSYTIEYRPQGKSNWAALTGIPPLATSAAFVPPDGRTYEFRSQATDTAGNVESPHATADITTQQAILLDHAIMLPVVRRD
jgi:hypothetical protein